MEGMMVSRQKISKKKYTKLTHVFGDVVRVFDANSNSETTDWEPKNQQPNHPVKAIEKSGFNDFMSVLKIVGKICFVTIIFEQIYLRGDKSCRKWYHEQGHLNISHPYRNGRWFLVDLKIKILTDKTKFFHLLALNHIILKLFSARKVTELKK